MVSCGLSGIGFETLAGFYSMVLCGLCGIRQRLQVWSANSYRDSYL